MQAGCREDVDGADGNDDDERSDGDGGDPAA